MHREAELVTRFDKTNRRTTLGAQTAKRSLKKTDNTLSTRRRMLTSKLLQGIAIGPKGLAFWSGKVLVFVCRVLAYSSPFKGTSLYHAEEFRKEFTERETEREREREAHVHITHSILKFVLFQNDLLIYEFRKRLS